MITPVLEPHYDHLRQARFFCLKVVYSRYPTLSSLQIEFESGFKLCEIIWKRENDTTGICWLSVRLDPMLSPFVVRGSSCHIYLTLLNITGIFFRIPSRRIFYSRWVSYWWRVVRRWQPQKGTEKESWKTGCWKVKSKDYDVPWKFTEIIQVVLPGNDFFSLIFSSKRMYDHWIFQTVVHYG